ncbi:unnamed protein product, partial [Prorocentrum cordatum]
AVLAKKGVEKNKVAREWRFVRDKTRGFLSNKKLPDSVAMLAANWLTQLGMPVSEYGITVDYSLPQTVPEKDQDQFQRWFADIYNNHQKDATSKMCEVRDFMKTHGMGSSWGAVQFTPHFSFDVSDAEGQSQTTEPMKDLRMAVYCRSTGEWQSNVQSFPWGQAPIWMQQFVGISFVAVADPAWVAEHVDFNGYVETADSGALYKVPTCILREGSALYVPMGYVPFLVPTPPNVNWDSKQPSLKDTAKATAEVKHCACFGVSLFLEDGVLEKTSPQARAAASAAWAQTKNSQLPESIRTNPEVSKWFEKCGEGLRDETSK